MNRLVPVLLPLFLASCARAQPQNAPFPFVVPWDDGTPTQINLGDLSPLPAGANGRLVARGEHLVEESTGRRVRLFGVVWTFDSAFPSHEDATKVAARLKKYGVNAVRIHYIDGLWKGRSSIWKADAPGSSTIDPAQLDRLDFLLSELKRNGVYVNFNLKVARAFAPEDGFPASVKELPEFSKRADMFDPKMIALQKAYARAILTHHNPYTGLTLASDPGVYLVEMNNENTLSGDDEGAGLIAFPAAFGTELQEQWNTWLRARYRTMEALQNAWSRTNLPLGPNLLVIRRGGAVALSGWNTEQHDPIRATFGQDGAITRASVRNADGIGWHAQLVANGLDLREGATYTFSMRARAKAPAKVGISFSRDQADWGWVGPYSSVKLTSEWQSVRIVFVARGGVPGHSRVTIELGENDGDFEFAGAELRQGAEIEPLAPGQTLENRSIPLTGPSFGRQNVDWTQFLADTEIGYAREMRRFLKQDVGVQSSVLCSQMSYGGAVGPYREGESDISDMHLYWDHPQVAGSWDQTKNRLSNTPMTSVAGDSSQSVFVGAMRYRVAGRPFSVSEINFPAPNEYEVEALPLIGAWAARQDFDVVLLHEYGPYGAGHENDVNRISQPFVIGSNPAKWGFVPSMARAFRQGLFDAAPVRYAASMPARFRPAADGSFSSVSAAWKNTDLTNAPFNGQTRLYLGALVSPIPTLGDIPLIGKLFRTKDTRLEVLAPGSTNSIFQASSSRALALSGYVGGRTVAVSDWTLRFGEAPNRFAAFSAVAQDGAPLSSSKSVLLSLAARVDNTNWRYAEDRKSMPDWGTGPTLLTSVPLVVTLKTDGARRVWALDATGKHTLEVPSTWTNGTLSFALSPEQKTMWWTIER